MRAMTRRERLARCYFNLETDRPAVYSRSGFPAGDRTYERLKELLAARTELKAGWSGGQFEAPWPLKVARSPGPPGFLRRVEVLRTPRGELRRVFLESTTGQPGLAETFFVNDPAAAECYLSLPAPGPAGDPLPLFRAAEAAVGDRGIVSVGIGLNPAGFTAELCGSTNFALLSVTDRPLLHRLCVHRLEVLRRRLEFLVTAGVGPFFEIAGQEYLVPPLHGPKDFADFNTRYDKPLVDLVHDAGGRVHVHCHGAIRRVLPGFLEIGVDVLHPFEAPPGGDVTAREAKELVRGRMCLEGNIQIHRMYEAPPDDIRRETAGLVRDAWDDRRGLIVSPTASPYIRGRGLDCLPRYRAMIDAVLNPGD